MTNEKAVEIQEELRKKVIIKPLEKEIKFICGIDSSYKENLIFTAGIICTFPEFEIVERVFNKRGVNFPYIPEFLAFREKDAIIETIGKIKTDVDCFILNGHGIAHPRKIGLASHIGVLINKPTIGCAKNILYGNFAEPPSFPLSSTFIKDSEGEIIGHVLRNYTGGIIFVSPGHLIDFKDSLSIVIKCMKKEYSLPYPLYLAHKYSKEIQ